MHFNYTHYVLLDQVWLYHSHTDEVADTYAGLVGALVISKKGMANSDGTPNDVDSEVFTFFQVNDENSRCVLWHILEFVPCATRQVKYITGWSQLQCIAQRHCKQRFAQRVSRDILPRKSILN